MSKVHVLPADVISKIAAGEVVERPASVVKELLENALDAGATRVEIHLKDGGKSLVHIKDNGHGIAKEDLAVLFTRHATSKIRSGDDLEAISSLGFRGEALYSVASVAEVVLKSRAAEAKDAWEITVRGGEKTGIAPTASAAPGTDIRVADLFFNTPARKKFLKSDSAEFEQAMNIVMPYALLYPDRHFAVTHHERVILDLAPAKSIIERVAQALRLEKKFLIESRETCTEDGVAMTLVLGDINIQRPRRDLQYLFVNGRPVQSRNLSFHINETYKLILPPSVHPFFAVMIEVAPSEVDVNIHPTKREVRLRKEARIGALLRQVVERALMTRGGAREMTGGGSTDAFSFPAMGTPREEGLPAEKMIFAPGQTGFLPALVSSGTSVSSPPGQGEQLSADFTGRPAEPLKDRLGRARFLGTFVHQYHLFEEGDALFVIDQHAAQERILFEKFRRQIRNGALEVQHLLVPIVLRPTPQEMLAWEEGQEKLRAFGFETALLDQETIAIQSHPVLIEHPEQAVRVLLGEEGIDRADPETVARRACRASVMAGDRMADIEAAHQLKTLLACEDPFTCPHGRPVFIELRSSFLNRQFLRT